MAAGAGLRALRRGPELRAPSPRGPRAGDQRDERAPRTIRSLGGGARAVVGLDAPLPTEPALSRTPRPQLRQKIESAHSALRWQTRPRLQLTGDQPPCVDVVAPGDRG